MSVWGLFEEHPFTYVALKRIDLQLFVLAAKCCMHCRNGTEIGGDLVFF